MAAERQLIGKYQKERAALRQQVAAAQARIAVLDSAIDGLRGVTGERPKASGRRDVTGTKAQVLDLLAKGERRSLREIASALRVAPSALAYHLDQLVASGDVQREGKSRAMRYRIP